MSKPTIHWRSSPESRNLVAMALDVRRFSSLTDPERNRVAVAFRDATAEAFTRSGLAEAWHRRVFEQNAGDGIVTGFHEEHLGAIVDRIPAALQSGLRELHQRSGLNVRMRMGLAIGPVSNIDDPRIDIAPNEPIITACRLADSAPARTALAHSDAAVTFLSVALSPEAVTFTVRSNPLWLRESEFVKVRIEMADKGFHTDAHLHVPTLSGDLLKFGLAGPYPPEAAESEGPARSEARPADSEPARQLPHVTGVIGDNGNSKIGIIGDHGRVQM
ncbi:hypothetical protein [Glycomyces buryatensis]|uniref:Adenylate/guanylate cyclase domain-containing protein n=1 Tax=Glycomyces buryatensis TaxID=2570927 RepID=A0A4V4HSJ2_9ACTN|nr:hypothetical protein [Glycomyces buryatensis]THV41926.1 hypothetical protein FAB82_09420 [Glycomyces buryatensis]